MSELPTTGHRCTYVERKPTAICGELGFPCGAEATHVPLVDDAFAKWMRNTSTDPGEEYEPVRKPLCGEHKAAFEAEVEAQRPGELCRTWIVEEAVV